MAYFPFFVDLEGKHGLIVGGGAVALRKAQKLLPYGPRLTVVAPKLKAEFWELHGVEFLRRPFAVTDLDGCAFAVAATDDRALNHCVAELCGQQRIPVNVADSREDSTFLFPALLRRGELSVGVSASGASPAAAAWARDRFAQALPENLEDILQYLENIRELLRQAVPDGETRRRLLAVLAADCMEAGRPLTEEELHQRLADAERGERI